MGHTVRSRLLAVSIAALLVGCAGGPLDDGLGRAGADVFAVGRDLFLVDSVAGDLMVAASGVELTGIVGGDYLGVGARQELLGLVGGNLRAVGGELLLTGEVARNAMLAGGRIDVSRTAHLAGNAFLAAGEVVVSGRVDGVLWVAAGEVVLDGDFGEHVRVEAGSLVVGPGAVVADDLRYRVPPGRVRIDPAARIGGDIVALEPQRGWFAGLDPLGGRPWRRALRIICGLGFLVAGAVFTALCPARAMAAAAAVQQRTAAALGWGVLWVLAAPVLIVVLAVTLVGLPLALIAAVAYAVSLYLGRAVLAIWVGRLLLGERLSAGRSGAVLGFLTGGVLILLAGLLPLAGAVIVVIATLLGLGAWLSTFREPVLLD